MKEYTRKEMYGELLTQLRTAEIEFPETECGFIIEHVTGKRYMDYVKLHPDQKADSSTVEKAFEISERRIKGEPLQYIFGEWDFYGLTFKVGEGVLIPRGDTEVLVEKALELLEGVEKPVMADLCSGSGCIPAAVCHMNRTVSACALEKSPEAFKYLTENMESLKTGVKPMLCDVLHKSVAEGFRELHIITANPPYLTERDMAELQAEVKYEPEMALYGGTDGLYFYREIASLWKASLREGGWLIFELGLGQYKDVMDIMTHAGYRDVSYVCDYAGIERVVFGRK